MPNNFKRLFPLLLLIFIDSFGYFVVIPILLELFFKTHYGILPVNTSMPMRDFLTGFTICLSTFTALIAAPFVGNLSDKFGRKKILLFCLMGVTFGFALPIVGILKKNLLLVLVGRALGGVGSSSQAVAQAAVADLCKDDENKALFLSFIALMMTLPIMLGPLVGGYLSDNHLVSWFSATTPYCLATIISFFCFFIILFFFQETRASTIHAEILSVSDVVFGFKKAIKHYHIGALLVIFFCLELAWSQYYQSISLFLTQQFHYSVQQISLYNALMGVFMSLGLLFLYPMLIKYFSIRKIMANSVLLVFLGLLLCAILPAYQLFFVWCVAIFTGTAYVSLLTLISNQAPKTHQGWIMGYSSTVLFLAWLITGFNGGLLISLHATLSLWVAAAMAGVAFWVALKTRYVLLPRFVE
ncbi:MAG: MFS transporter [Gammaproteobacteria bacterium]|nr:MFS transporter [Gammaproteobacteria bacterium]